MVWWVCIFFQEFVVCLIPNNLDTLDIVDSLLLFKRPGGAVVKQLPLTDGVPGSIPAWWHSAKALASHRCDLSSIPAWWRSGEALASHCWGPGFDLSLVAQW